jgi:hypothetical protein
LQANLQTAWLDGAQLQDTELRMADLTRAKLRDAHLHGAKLNGAVLKKADLSTARLDNAQMRTTDLSEADLTGARLLGADLTEAKWTDRRTGTGRGARPPHPAPGAADRQGALTMTPANPSRLDVGGRLLTVLRETLELTDRLHQRSLEPAFWAPRPASVLDRELRNTEVDQQGTAWGPDEPTYAWEMARMSMVAVGDHLASIRKLLEPPLPIYGQAVLARSVFESAAFAFWMTDPQITVRQRVARAYLVFWDEARTARKNAGKVGTPEDITAAQGHLDTVVARVNELGVTRAVVQGKETVEGQQIPTKTALIAALFAGDVRHGHQGIYSPYSSVTHGEMTGLLTRRLTVAAGGAVLTITPRQLIENVELAMIAFRALHRRLCSAGMGAQPNLQAQLWEHNVGRRMQAIHRKLV